jgi:hydrogenase expression/formation protein HypC
MGTVDFGGVRREVCLAYVANDIQVGDYAIIHVGFAISKVSEEEARRTYQVLEEMSQLDELEWLAELTRDEASAASPRQELS